MDDGDKKADEKKVKDSDIERVFIASSVLPNVAESFVADVDPLAEAVKNGDIVVDTNALLIPYGAGASSLNAISVIFKKLKQESRIYIPGQVAREFIKNRPNKIAELQQGIADKISQIFVVEKLSYPILEGVHNYSSLNESIVKMRELKKEILRSAAKLKNDIYSWGWSDPVYSSYREIFSEDVIVELNLDKSSILEEMRKRYKFSIPPGYKDVGKDDEGIGDFIIWKTILDLGSKNKKNLVFVSGDEKPDWQHRTGSTGFLPRYELFDEYRRVSGGKGFYMIQLSQFLELLSVAEDSVTEIKQEEERIKEELKYQEGKKEDSELVTVCCPHCAGYSFLELGEEVGSSAQPQCPSCSHYFHVHRVSGGVMVNRPNERRGTELISCPACYLSMPIKIGAVSGEMRLCKCRSCSTVFKSIRSNDGSIVSKFLDLEDI